jgi:hypothetical protein
MGAGRRAAQPVSDLCSAGAAADRAAALCVQATPLGRWIWHEALFDTALFVCVLYLVVRSLGPL